MLKIKKYINVIGAIFIVLLFTGTIVYSATFLRPYQGGSGLNVGPNKGDLMVGTSTSAYHRLPTSTIGYVLTVTSTPPYLSWEKAAEGGAATTTINSVAGPTFTFGTSTDTNLGLLISTSTGQLTFTPVWIGTLANDRIASSSYWGNITGTGQTNYIPKWTSTINLSTTTISEVNSTTTIAGDVIIDSGAAGTSTLSIGETSNQGCIEMQDSNVGGWSHATFLEGVMYINLGKCGD